jgi:general secretion pathway protein G
MHREPVERGFTLLEIMVVVAIIAILAALVVPQVMGRPDEARIVAARHDVAAIMQGLKLYRLDRKRYPTAQEGLAALSTAHLERLPRDPWGNPYQYLNPGVHGEVDVFSYGAAGAPGGEGAAADIGSWSL